PTHHTIYPLPLHDALPIYCDDENACTIESCDAGVCHYTAIADCTPCSTAADCDDQNACTFDSCNAGVCHNTAIAGCTPCSTVARSEEHTSELQSRGHLVCR